MLTLTVGRRIFAAFLLNLGFFCGLDFCQANPKHQAAQFAAGISNQFQNASSVANFLAWAGFESQVAQLKSQMTSSELKAPWPLINAEGSRLLTEDGRLLIEILSFDKESVNLQVGGRPLRIHFQKDPQPQLAPLLKISARQQSPWISTALAAEEKLQETPLFRLGYLFNAINSVVALGYILTTPSAPGSMLGGFGRFLAGSSVLGFGLFSAGRAFADENVVSFSSCQGSQLLSAETSSGKRLLVQIEDGSNKNPKKILTSIDGKLVTSCLVFPGPNKEGILIQRESCLDHKTLPPKKIPTTTDGFEASLRMLEGLSRSCSSTQGGNNLQDLSMMLNGGEISLRGPESRKSPPPPPPKGPSAPTQGKS